MYFAALVVASSLVAVTSQGILELDQLESPCPYLVALALASKGLGIAFTYQVAIACLSSERLPMGIVAVTCLDRMAVASFK